MLDSIARYLVKTGKVMKVMEPQQPREEEPQAEEFDV